MKKSRALTVLPFAMVGLLLVPSTGFGLNRRDLLPDDTVATLDISNTTDLVKAFARTSLGRMWNDPQIRQFLGHPDLSELLRETLSEGDEKNAEKSKLIWDSLLMLNGEMILAFPASFEDFSPIIVAAMTEKDFLRSMDMDRRIAELTTDKTYTIRRHQFQGTDLFQHIEESRDGSEKKTSETWQAFMADTLVYGPSRDWVEKSLVRLKQQKPGEPTGPAPSLKLRLNIPVLLRLALEEEEKNRKDLPADLPTGIPSMKDVFAALGLMTVGELTLTASIHPDRTEVETSLPVSDMSKGLFSMFDTRPSSPNLRVPFVPATAYGYGVSRVNLAALVRQLPGIVKEAAPAMAAQFDMAWAMIDMFLGINLERDLLSHFDTQVVSLSSMADRQGADVAAIRLNNDVQVKNALAKMFADGGQLKSMLASSLREEEFLGAKLYAFATTPTGETMPSGGPDPAPVYVLTVDSGYLLYGSELGVRHAVRALNSADAETGFYDSKLARKMLAGIPPRAYQYSAYNWAEFSKAALDNKVYTQIQTWAEDAAREAIADDPSSAWAQFLAKVDFTRWPTIGHVTSFLGPSFDYAVQDGATLRSKSIFHHENKP